MFVKGCLDIALAQIPLDIAQKRTDAQLATLQQLLECLIITVAHEKLADAFTSYFDDVCRYFSVLIASKQFPAESQVFVDSLIYAIRAENRSYSKCALRAIDLV